jgi:hypothetical protein
MAAAAPPLVIIVLSSWGDDRCGDEPWPAPSGCAEAGGTAAAAVVSESAGAYWVVVGVLDDGVLAVGEDV